jgi:hypothetical protein
MLFRSIPFCTFTKIKKMKRIILTLSIAAGIVGCAKKDDTKNNPTPATAASNDSSYLQITIDGQTRSFYNVKNGTHNTANLTVQVTNKPFEIAAVGINELDGQKAYLTFTRESLDIVTGTYDYSALSSYARGYFWISNASNNAIFHYNADEVSCRLTVGIDNEEYTQGIIEYYQVKDTISNVDYAAMGVFKIYK